jgi:hypothetical protein
MAKLLMGATLAHLLEPELTQDLNYFLRLEDR